ncbi:glycosyltransferase family 1 protein [Rhodoferax sp.]|uniref:glycosyltransferase family 4 protein n=1 Tax=Rhodoferax sp. TaxID=50421 RepID=UPI00261D8C96|nr:glycosyltransferase family 1 protein [Rhodoferax sp.]MDD5478439.1 glycosyltransferase family 1 protein [Rhodoferax sp.]
MSSKPWGLRLASMLFHPFPRAKHFVVHRVLAPWHNWRSRRADAGRVPVTEPNPGLELRLLKLEGALHLMRVGQPQLAAGTIGPVTSPMRRLVLMDMRITQISMRERGIPRYTTALAQALPTHLVDADMAYLVDPTQPMPDAIAALKAHGRIVYGAAEISALPHVSHFLQSCIFELHKDAEELFPAELARFRPHLSAIVYDLIPWLYPQQYLADPYLARRYAYQLSLLPAVHHLFAISECAREDIIRIGNLPPSSITNIYGGIDETRWLTAPTRPADPQNIEICNEQGERFVLRAPYWLYVGGDDFRKNVQGLVRAFASVLAELAPAQGRPALVIACNLRPAQRKDLVSLADTLRMQPGVDIIITGYVSDAVLATCYSNAFATVFPSLYEGLGLPVLESYHFGVPALASGTSSLTEVTPPNCQFDPSSDESIAQAMLRMHHSPTLRAESLAYGAHILAKCNWQRAASKLASHL